MNVFADYSKYYDLLYADKAYQQEADFVISLLKTHGGQKIQTLLELGAGTGKHALHLAHNGFDVLGVDQSATMLEMAGMLQAKQPQAIANKLRFMQADIRELNLNQTFDAAIALFHVMSYQTSNQDIEKTIKNVKKHVKPGGLFVFDCWYGPAVFAQKPQVRYRRFQNELLTVDRVAVPTHYENNNTVNVHYHLYAQDSASDTFQKMEEDHLMRYFFLPEIEQLCAQYEMKIELACEWLTQKPLSADTWGACLVIRLL